MIGAGVFAAKASFGVFVQVWLRWTLPRLRIDQVMTTCLKYLVPISCFLFLGATIWPLLLLTGMGRATWTGPIGDRAAQGLQEARQGSVDLTKAVEPGVTVGLAVPVSNRIESEGVLQ